jgi:hypothetical protein
MGILLFTVMGRELAISADVNRIQPKLGRTISTTGRYTLGQNAFITTRSLAASRHIQWVERGQRLMRRRRGRACSRLQASTDVLDTCFCTELLHNDVPKAVKYWPLLRFTDYRLHSEICTLMLWDHMTKGLGGARACLCVAAIAAQTVVYKT